MATKISQLQCKEVICIGTGRRLGFIQDVEVEIPEGKVCALVGPGRCRFFGLLGREDDYILPWDCIARVGSDIILVEAKGEFMRRKRQGRLF